MRINPECSTQEGHDIYDPCAQGSRMGTTRAQWDEAVQKNPELLDLLDGLHFHTLCEQDSDDLETTLVSVKKHFGDFASRVKWINFGGGHHITRPGYDIERLERCIRTVQEEWKAEVYLEPGEAWASTIAICVSPFFRTSSTLVSRKPAFNAHASPGSR